MNQKKNIIFVYPFESSFVKADIDIFKLDFKVKLSHNEWRKKWKIPFSFLKQFFFLLIHVRRTDRIVVSFGGYWAIIPVLMGGLFRTPVSIILHGTDCASFPEINYGNLNKPVLKRVLGFCYKHATSLLPVSKALIYNENKYYLKDKVVKQGINYFYEKISTPMYVIPNGIDCGFWKNINTIKREQYSFITVLSANRFFLKGGDLIIDIAEANSNCNFFFAGINVDEVEFELPKNVFFLGRLTSDQLLEAYNATMYYFQLSMFEGFGYALCEAMSCGCVPIVSEVNILPDIIGDSGFILPTRSAKELNYVVQKAIKSDQLTVKSIKARKRIVENYTIENRRKQLYKVLV